MDADETRRDVKDGPPTVRLDATLVLEGERYETLDVLGRGGMGEVKLSRDRRIGREVAIKTELAPQRANESRFLREALVQGQLEHPAVVPVYDIAVTGDGAAYFVMKRVRGASMREIIESLSRGEVTPDYTRHKLLAALARVCLAVEFAHARGVVHRDLKPANVMLGVFGEVYVLDWGIAKVTGAPDPEVGAPAVDARVTSSGPHTAEGVAIGTPGYMAPEQLDGEATVKTDVYALGVMLFEILTLERLHRGTLHERMQSTLTGETGMRERLAAHDVAPELVAICERATQTSLRERFASARDLHDAIEGFLAGDRDLELRRALARDHAARAESLATTNRSAALRALGRALAFDPENDAALRLLRSLLTSVPETFPAEVEAEILTAQVASETRSARGGTRAMPFLASMVIVFVAMGVRSWPLVGVFLGAVLVAVAASASTRPPRVKRYIVLVSLLTAAVVTARMFGPVLLVPTMIMSMAAPFMIHLRRAERYGLLFPLALTALLGPIVLEWTGVIDPSYALRDGALVVLPHAVSFTWLTVPAILFFSVLSIATPLAIMGVTADGLANAQRAMAFQTWQLRQLAPEDRDSKRVGARGFEPPTPRPPV
jgi:serine/threonine protein kinase